jgi:hypothetical protein
MTRSIRWRLPAFAATAALALNVATASASTPGGDVRLTHDDGSNGGYLSAYTLATGTPYTDATLTECSHSKGRQNEPAVAVDPRNTQVLIGSSNDYCGVYNNGVDSNGAPIPSGPVWLGYYRSENGGASFISSLVPGYPDDRSPYAALAHVRTAGAGDPVIAWDNHGRVFMGSESSGDPAGTAKTFGDVWVARYVNPGGPGGATANDGKQYRGTVTVARGSAAPNLLGKFHDKTAIEVDRTGGSCDGIVYFAWARFTGNTVNGFNSSVYLVRSTDHGATFSTPVKLSQTVHDIQFPDISVTHNGHVYVTYRQFADVRSNQTADAVIVQKSTNCGLSFSAPRPLATFEPYDATDLSDSGALAGTCGDFASHCQSGYTFFRRTTQVRSTADQLDASHEYIYVVYDPSKPGTEVPSGTTYGSVVSGDLPVKYHRNVGSQSGVYFIRLNGATGALTTPRLIDDEATGHQLFPDISADGGVLHATWWDSRNDANYSPMRPVGNAANGLTGPALDVFGSNSTNAGTSWATATRISDVTTNPNYEQFAGRTFPFAGDYLWTTSLGSFAFTVWTDWRNTVAGVDQREGTTGDPYDHDGADVLQCREPIPSGGLTGDKCPRDGGLDQNIYGDFAP